MSNKTDDLFAEVTDKLITMIEDAESGKGKWSKPWTTVLAGAGIGTNVTTKKEYKGWNIIALMMSQAENEFTYPLWATYKQWAGIGAQVQGGEKGTQLVRWGVSYRCAACGTKGATPCDAGHPNERTMWATLFTVFNADQVDGYEVVEEDLGDEPTRLAAVETFVENTGAVINYVKQNRAFYDSLVDEITMPVREQFNTPASFYGTELHELTHWAGGPNRLDRTKGKAFGDNAYAAEELVAELGSAFLSARYGIEVEPHMDHAKYLSSWLDALKSDPKALYRAAKMAQESVGFLTDLADTEAAEKEEAA